MSKRNARLALIFLAIFMGSASGVSAQRCVNCHNFKRLGQWVHAPFENGKCQSCHGGASSRKGGGKLDIQEAKWVLRRHFFGGKGLIFLPRRVRGKFLVFQADTREDAVPLSPESVASLPIKTAREPKILQAFPCEIEEGIFLEATLCVETNVPTEIEVRCGNQVETSSGDFFTRHRIVLGNLKKDAIYQAKIIARDISGRVSRSRVVMFRMDKTIKTEQFKNEGTNEISIRLFHFPPNEMVLAIESGNEIDWRLGILPDQSVKNTSMPKNHPVIRSLLYSGIEACYKCHPDEKLGVSHPVNISLKNGMKAKGVPLFGKVMTCSSCHEPHSANIPYLLRKKEDDLCVSCHGERYRK